METKDISNKSLALYRQAGETVAKCYIKFIKLYYSDHVRNLRRIKLYGFFAFVPL